MGSRHAGNGFGLHDFKLFVDPYLYRYPQVETTFYVGILPVVSLFVLLFFLFRKVTFIALFGVTLFLYALTIAFALIGPELIHKVPTLNSSLLTRFGYLLDVSLAIIVAYVVHEIYKRVEYKKWGMLLMFILFGIQIADQRSLFHAFNDAVPNASFYPKTKTISYLQRHMKPFEHVIADRGFLIAGTLGGYGLNDWFAHSFHSGAEKKILRQLVNKPFKTPTSAMFAFSQVDLDSPYMDYLAIKAIVSTSYSKYLHIDPWDNTRPQQPTPNMPTNRLNQPFHIDKPVEASGIALKMATYGAKRVSSDVALTLTKENEAVEKVIVPKEKIQDNAWVPFIFKQPIIFTQGNYAVSVKMTDPQNPTPLTVWANKNETNHKLKINKKESTLSLKMALIREKEENKKYKILNLEPNIYIFENRDVENGAYFLSALNTQTPVNYTQTKTTLLCNTEIQIEYSGTKPGWVVLPMRNYPGWNASIDGKQVKIDTFLDMLPAVKVNGKSTILLQYSPEYNRYTYLAALLSLIVLLLSILKFRKKD